MHAEWPIIATCRRPRWDAIPEVTVRELRNRTGRHVAIAINGYPAVYELIPLDRLPPGRAAEIDRLIGQPAHVQRLEEMGLRRGAKVEMVRCGRPCIVRTGGNRLCFRCSDLLGVLVREPSPV